MEDINSRRKGPGTVYIFIDEIQRKADIGLFLKYIYDRNTEFKFIVTGSSSLSIKNIVSEPLTGRKFEYFLAPLDIFEILKSKGVDARKLQTATPEVEKTMDDLLLFGGYPSVWLLKNREEKARKLQEIAKSYITRDLAAAFRINNPEELESVAVYLAQNTGNLLSRENIAKTLSQKVNRVNTYLTALKKSFIVGLLRPFYRNPVAELSHRPKIYFVDNGIRNVLLQKTYRELIAGDRGKLFEQTVWQLLVNLYPDHLKYWRNINQTEVDFVVDAGEGLKAYEAKYLYERTALPKNLASFKKIYGKELADIKVISKENLVRVLAGQEKGN
jgi:predicted AAA+ superfamily ATPase